MITNSEASVPFDDTIQINATIRGCNPRFGCSVGFKFVMVLSEPIRVAIRIHFPSGK